MSVQPVAYQQVAADVASHHVTLVAVSKTKPVEDIMALYELGQRDFGENYVQELSLKQKQLPADIRWHFIGHLQTNKAKILAPYVHLVQSVDSLKLLGELDAQGRKTGRVINCLLQVHIAKEDTKFGFSAAELETLVNDSTIARMDHIIVRGLMGMASFVDDLGQAAAEFRTLKNEYEKLAVRKSPNWQLSTLSMGMSSDYKVAIEEGSTMVRIGSLLFGARE
ncbi:MAG TPA: YggS family pyridoxal phosphate-dependent enzyme [Chitinophagaceae bacterium]|jgi:pyridoxal phosphate enzyme (YggS family)